MNRKKVLIICMFDSIHTAHWIERVKSLDIDYELFPSKVHRRIHPKIIKLLKKEKNINLFSSLGNYPLAIHGYIDYALEKLYQIVKGGNFRYRCLKRKLATRSFDFIHALEIQGAGYLCGDLNIPASSRLIVTNWGSDIYYYINDSSHTERIKNLLNKTDRYSAECFRDYKLARELGFKGIELPMVPNSGGNYECDVDFNDVRQDLVVVKTYGGLHGRGDLAINAVKQLLQADNSYQVFFYSVGEDNLDKVKKIHQQFPHRVQYSTVKKSLEHAEIISLFQRAKIYLGCSESDGISTSFLEAISHGVYPIQTTTSCADEWVIKGITASLVPLDQNIITNELIRIAKNWSNFEIEIINNLKIAKTALDPTTITSKSRTFYDN